MSNQENEPRILTEEEIAKLPRLAIVAFAARCARRVYPLFELDWPEAPYQDKDDLNEAIIATEDFATYNTIYASPDAYADLAKDLANDLNNDTAAHIAAYVIANATYAASYADATHTAAYTAAYSACATDNFIKLHILIDFNKLKKAAESEKWTDDTPVAPEFFGPLWPDGEPDWKNIIAK